MKKITNSSHVYDDIIQLPHHVSVSHPHMANCDRAAQFLPFAALTGHEASIKETARLTDQRIELDESHKEILNEKLSLAIEKLSEHPIITITYFVPDGKKDGGSYVTTSGSIKKFNEYEGLLIMLDGTRISLDRITEIDGEM